MKYLKPKLSIFFVAATFLAACNFDEGALMRSQDANGQQISGNSLECKQNKDCLITEVCDKDVGRCRKIEDCPDKLRKCFATVSVIPSNLYNGPITSDKIDSNDGSYLGGAYELILPNKGISNCFLNEKYGAYPNGKSKEELGMLGADQEKIAQAINAEQSSVKCFWFTLGIPLPIKLQTIAGSSWSKNAVFLSVELSNSIIMSNSEPFVLQMLPDYEDMKLRFDGSVMTNEYLGFDSVNTPKFVFPIHDNNDGTKGLMAMYAKYDVSKRTNDNQCQYYPDIKLCKQDNRNKPKPEYCEYYSCQTTSMCNNADCETSSSIRNFVIYGALDASNRNALKCHYSEEYEKAYLAGKEYKNQRDAKISTMMQYMQTNSVHLKDILNNNVDLKDEDTKDTFFLEVYEFLLQCGSACQQNCLETTDTGKANCKNVLTKTMDDIAKRCNQYPREATLNIEKLKVYIQLTEEDMKR